MKRLKAKDALALTNKFKSLKKMPEIYKKIEKACEEEKTSLKFSTSELSREHIDMLLDDGYTVVTNREDGDYHRVGPISDYEVCWAY